MIGLLLALAVTADAATPVAPAAAAGREERLRDISFSGGPLLADLQGVVVKGGRLTLATSRLGPARTTGMRRGLELAASLSWGDTPEHLRVTQWTSALRWIASTGGLRLGAGLGFASTSTERATTGDGNRAGGPFAELCASYDLPGFGATAPFLGVHATKGSALTTGAVVAGFRAAP